MAAPTATRTTYGWRVTGGTDATVIVTNQQIVNKISYIPATGSNALTVEDQNGNNIDKIIGATADTSETRWFEDSPFDGIKLTLAEASDIVHIFIT